MQSKAQKVSVFLYQEISSRLKNDNLKLPPILELARRARVSPRTLQHGIDLYRKKGILVTKPGKGVWISGKIETNRSLFPKSPLVVRSKFRSDQIAARLMDDILCHRFTYTDRIPSIEELKTRYNANYRTVKRALDIIDKQDIVPLFKPEPAQAQPLPRSFQNEIICIVRVKPSGRLLLEAERLIQNLQEICSKRNMRLRIFKMHYIGTSIEFLFPREKASFFKLKPHEPIGCIVYTLGINKGLSALLDMVRLKFICPRILLGWPAKLNLLKTYPFRDSFVNFAIENSQVSGNKIGSYLYSLGHKKVAFFQSAQKADWSITRYNGIKDVYESAGMENAVPIFRLPEKEFSRFEEDMYQIDLKPFSTRFSSVQRALSDMACDLSYDKMQERELIDQTRETSRGFYRANMLYQFFSQLLKKIIFSQDVSALICDNDLLAISFLRILKNLNISVPSQMSIISFDDSPEALASNLTSYNFNRYEQMRCLIDFLIQYKSLKTIDPYIYRFEHAGFINVRNTVADLSNKEKTDS